jgi:hypothetical protein
LKADLEKFTCVSMQTVSALPIARKGPLDTIQ